MWILHNMQPTCFPTFPPPENRSLAVATGPTMFGFFLSFRTLLSVNLDPSWIKEILSAPSTSLLRDDSNCWN
jgi:hypothetical protein